ncbi:MAG: XdhC family protein [Actinomycetota bacterium]
MTDPACALAQGDSEPPQDGRRLVAVFTSPVAQQLLHFGEHLGFETVLCDPSGAEPLPHAGATVSAVAEAGIDARTDVVVTDHDRPELGPVLRDVLGTPARWVGVMGSPRHAPPHVPALRELGVAEDTIARVHRPIGLNIGSRTPPEIALATLAGLLADRAGRPGGFEFGHGGSGRTTGVDPAARASV